MKTFLEFSQVADKKTTLSFPTFSEIKEGKGSSCMSEELIAKCNEMYEAMCEEMSSCHEDKTEHTAETYNSECGSMLQEMIDNLQAKCNEYMKK
jgi:hypothetical protein